MAEVSVKTTNSGTFLVLVSNLPFYSDAASGTYLLNLAQIGSPFFVSPGDEGGSFVRSNNYNGTILMGDLDLWSFTACLGEFIDVRATQLTDTNGFDPWVRLYGPDGVLVGSNFGLTSGEVTIVTTNAGSYVVVISNNDANGNAGNGTYQLTVNSLVDGLKLCAPVVLGTNFAISGVGGASNSTFTLYTQTNVAAPFANWQPFLTNQFNGYGLFVSTNRFDINEPARFFRMTVP